MYIHIHTYIHICAYTARSRSATQATIINTSKKNLASNRAKSTNSFVYLQWRHLIRKPRRRNQDSQNPYKSLEYRRIFRENPRTSTENCRKSKLSPSKMAVLLIDLHRSLKLSKPPSMAGSCRAKVSAVGFIAANVCECLDGCLDTSSDICRKSYLHQIPSLEHIANFHGQWHRLCS